MTVNAYDDVKICTAALAQIGEGGINSISEPKTDIEAICAILYPLAISTLLARHGWNFATTIRQLAANLDATEELKAGYAYAYKIPSDLIAGPFAIYAERNFRRPVQDYLPAQNHIMSNAAVLHVKYRLRPDVSAMPHYFVDLLITDLSSRLAKPVADNSSLATEMRIRAYGPAEMDGAGGLFGVAKALDSCGSPMRSMFDNGDPLTATRF